MQISGKKIQTFLLRNGYLLIIAAWLITLSFIVNNYWWYISSPTQVQKNLEGNIQSRESEFQDFVANKELIKQLLNRNYDEEQLKEYTGQNKDFYLFMYKEGWETFWSTNQIALDSSLTNLSEGRHFKKLNSGYYEVIRKNIDSSSYVLGFIPIKEKYYFSNRYLPNRFYQLPRISNQYEINEEGDGIPVKSISGSILFYIHYPEGGVPHRPTWLSGLLLGLTIVSLLIFFNQLALYIGANYNRFLGWCSLLFTFVLLRGLNYLGLLPLGLEKFELFDSTVYASNLILKSLGDLLINVILVGWLIFYAYNQLRTEVRISKKVNSSIRYLLMILVNMATFFLVYYAVTLIRGVVINSKISFDVTDFFSLDIYSFIGFIILGLLGFSFIFLSPVINSIQNEFSRNRILDKYIVLGVSGFLWLMLLLFLGGALYSFWVMLWVVGYLCLMDLIEYWLADRFLIERLVLWLLLLTSTITAIVIYYNAERELNYRKQLVIKLAKQKDPTLIFNLSNIDSVLIKDPHVVSFYKNYKNRHNEILEDYLLDQYFSNLQNKYDFDFFTFNKEGKQKNSYNPTAGEVAQRLTNGGELTGFKNLYFKQKNISDFYYAATLMIDDEKTDSLLGYLYYRLSPKIFKPESLYPELLMQTTDYNFSHVIKKYAYAVYIDRHLIYHKNGYPFPLNLKLSKVPEVDFDHSSVGDYSVLRYKASAKKVVVIAKKKKDLLEAMTLFAYLFGTFLLLMLLFNLFHILIKSRLRLPIIRKMTRLNIRNRIYAIIVFIVIFVFVVLGISTIKFFVGRYDMQHKEQLDQKISSLEMRLQPNFAAIADTNAIIHFNHLEYNSLLKKKIQRVGKQEGADINIYDLDGNLRLSTQSLIYKNGLLSTKMDPSAYYSLQYMGQVQFTQTEHVGNLSFLSSYVPIRDESGQTLAFLNLPNYSSQSTLKREISNFLMTLINLNAFIFLLAGLLALILTHSITRSFTLIIEKLKNVKLTGKNEEIEWEYDDEIGRLVDEYNKMVHQLEESADKLAKSEREGAWKEMARQVAHEIKNPLTPMKLSLQHLQFAIKKDSPRRDELTNDVAQTIIEQIDHLSKIASDFSAFANISYARREKIILNDILASITSLYQGYEKVELSYTPPVEEIEIEADKTQINRVFTNLVQNAVQAIPEDRKAKISIKTRIEDYFAIIQIEDNGEGIKDDLKDRIFTPNFTTKTSGTGLGLAICKKIIQQYDGDIWFETTVGKGSSFFVKLPFGNKEKEEEL